MRDAGLTRTQFGDQNDQQRIGTIACCATKASSNLPDSRRSSPLIINRDDSQYGSFDTLLLLC